MEMADKVGSSNTRFGFGAAAKAVCPHTTDLLLHITSTELWPSSGRGTSLARTYRYKTFVQSNRDVHQRVQQQGCETQAGATRDPLPQTPGLV